MLRKLGVSTLTYELGRKIQCSADHIGLVKTSETPEVRLRGDQGENNIQTNRFCTRTKSLRLTQPWPWHGMRHVC